MTEQMILTVVAIALIAAVITVDLLRGLWPERSEAADTDTDQ